MHKILNERKLITVKEFCTEYGFGINKGYEIVNYPDFPKIKFGRNIYIVYSQIDNWINSKINIIPSNNISLRKENENVYNY